ncbi:MAG: nicotinate phosphoribosyltransferase [Armatimonadota bacterium]|nr:nicotinate phosphoribosyltransferase [Armatimonadota bacterium]MDR7484955.1 nicotinate phosphoribosyltransferase [Armatimonadota bacterium]MDR7533658.1 nicotinate phosphoribosyltransferase [Armatimonadota bacterium]MDR7535469.1 nicotinate phosphoribosyltransferase [Armatimonadota bacterium]
MALSDGPHALPATRPGGFGYVTPENVALLVDLYELTMADSYLRHGMNDRATFDLFVRALPPNRAFLVSAGLDGVLAYLEGLRFSDDAIGYLRGLHLFSDAFLDYLRAFRFTGDVRAIPEGEIFFPPEPILEVTAPRIEAQVIETFLLNATNVQVMVASKAARVVLAARGRAVADFSPRRDHGTDAALKAARAAYLAGCTSTSNVLAGMVYGIPVTGTMAHSYVMSFSDELTAFRAFARDFPHNTVLLIDTYDTMQGVANAIIVAGEMAARGSRLRGVRIDSGDLVAQSRAVRAALDAAGLREVQIILTGDLNEYRIAELLDQGAAADAFGVGTELGTSADAPSLGGVYKLVEDEKGFRIKLSTGKATLPGRKQVWRKLDADGQPIADVIALHDEPPPPEHTPLLVPVMQGGRRLWAEPLAAIRQRCTQRLATLPEELRSLEDAMRYPVAASAALLELRDRMWRQG